MSPGLARHDAPDGIGRGISDTTRVIHDDAARALARRVHGDGDADARRRWAGSVSSASGPGANATDPNAPPAPPAALTIEEMKLRAAEKLLPIPRFTKGEEQCYFFLRDDPSVPTHGGPFLPPAPRSHVG